MANQHTTPSAAAKVIRELVAKFPDAPALTLAKKAFREHPELWTDLETCRTAVRRVLGVMGDTQRKRATDKSLHRPPRKAGWTDVIPEALVGPDDQPPYEILGPHRTLILSDCHIPFHDVVALEAALEYGAKRKPTCILLNGDIMDHYALSRWETDPKLRDFPAEVRAGRYFFAGLRKRFPKARIVMKEGNHEFRLTAYLRLKAPDLLGLPEFEWENVFGLTDHRIEMVKDLRLIRLGKLNVLHGHEYRYSISNPVNPARGLMLRAKCNSICGHFHQEAKHTGKTAEGKIISTWSTGCLCNMKPAYLPLNEWSHGAAFVETDKDGAFHVENFRIMDGVVY